MLRAHKDHVITELASLRDLEAIVGREGPEPIAEPFPHRLRSLIDPGVWYARELLDDQDDVLRIVPHRPREVPLVDRGELIPEDVDARLGHA